MVETQDELRAQRKRDQRRSVLGGPSVVVATEDEVQAGRFKHRNVVSCAAACEQKEWTSHEQEFERGPGAPFSAARVPLDGLRTNSSTIDQTVYDDAKRQEP